jgi:hypothetical protein
MKISALALALAAMLPMAAQAQLYYDDYDWDDAYDDYAYVEDDYVPLTGDAGLDAMLVSINARFNDQPVYYAEQLAVGTRVQPGTLRSYLVERRYAPADVYMMGELSQLTGKSVTDVANAYDANRGKGWGAVARSLGIKPGSAQFHQLKRGGTTLVSAPPAQARAAARGVRTSQAQPPAAHPGKGHGKGKGQGKGKGKNK